MHSDPAVEPDRVMRDDSEPGEALDRAVDEAEKQSFPASDPQSSWAGLDPAADLSLGPAASSSAEAVVSSPIEAALPGDPEPGDG